jgi:hypothetical protein
MDDGFARLLAVNKNSCQAFRIYNKQDLQKPVKN